MTSEWEQLATHSVLHEHRFTSQARAVGSLIARLRGVWYNVAARWGDQALIDQQTAYNQAAVTCLRRVEERLRLLEAHLVDLEARQVEWEKRQVLLDRDGVSLTHTVGELTQQVIQLRQVMTAAQPHAGHDDETPAPGLF